MSDSSVPSSLTRRLLSTATAASVGLGAGLGVSSVGHVPAPSPEVLLAMEIGALSCSSLSYAYPCKTKSTIILEPRSFTSSE